MNQNNTLNTLVSLLPREFSVAGYVDEGGQGAVLQGSYHSTPAAIKIFAHTSNPTRLKHELDCLRTPPHDAIVRVLGHTSVSHLGFIFPVVAYEWCENGDLQRWLSPHSDRLSTAELVNLAETMYDAIYALWKVRIVHRDIKPANILLRDDSSYVLADLGFAQHLNRTRVTIPGANPGTSGYKSPEQTAGRNNLTVHSDIFSLGITIAELALGSHPWSGLQPSLSSRIDPRLIHTIATTHTRPIADQVARMLDPSPLNRPRRWTS